MVVHNQFLKASSPYTLYWCLQVFLLLTSLVWRRTSWVTTFQIQTLQPELVKHIHFMANCSILMYLNLFQLTSQTAQSTPLSSAALTFNMKDIYFSGLNAKNWFTHAYKNAILISTTTAFIVILWHTTSEETLPHTKHHTQKIRRGNHNYT